MAKGPLALLCLVLLLGTTNFSIFNSLDASDTFLVQFNASPQDRTINSNEEDVMQWQWTYGGSEADYAHAVIQTSDGGFAFAGYTLSFSEEDEYGRRYLEFWLVKTDDQGELQWSRTYDVHDKAYSLIETADGGFILVGADFSWYGGMPYVYIDTRLVKTDAQGKFQWKRSYESSDYTYQSWGNAVIETADGGFVFAGATAQREIGYPKAWLVKLDDKGVVNWMQTYDGEWWLWGEEGKKGWEANSVIETVDGGFALAGFVFYSNLNIYEDVWLMKTDVSGVEEWNRTYGEGAREGGYSVVQTPDGGFAIAGFTCSYGAGDADFWLLKTDSSGELLWNHTYGGAGDELARTVIQTDDGGFILIGSTTSTGVGKHDTLLVKTNAFGELLWNRIYGGVGEDEAYSVIQTTDGGFAFAGFTNSTGVGNYDAWLVKTDTNGLTPTTIYEKEIKEPFISHIKPLLDLLWGFFNRWSIRIVIAALFTIVAFHGVKRLQKRSK